MSKAFSSLPILASLFGWLLNEQLIRIQLVAARQNEASWPKPWCTREKNQKAANQFILISLFYLLSDFPITPNKKTPSQNGALYWVIDSEVYNIKQFNTKQSKHSIVMGQCIGMSRQNSIKQVSSDPATRLRSPPPLLLPSTHHHSWRRKSSGINKELYFWSDVTFWIGI